MRNEDELARIHNEYGKMSGTQKEFHAYGYMENMNNPVIDEKRLHEQLTDRISEISEIFEADDITATVYGNGIRFGLDFDGYKVKFEGGIVAYRDKTRMGSGAYTYLYDVSGKAEIYDGDKMVRVVEYNEVEFAFCKNNTAGTVGIYACGDMNCVSDSAQETHKFLVCE